MFAIQDQNARDHNQQRHSDRIESKNRTDRRADVGRHYEPLAERDGFEAANKPESGTGR